MFLVVSIFPFPILQDVEDAEAEKSQKFSELEEAESFAQSRVHELEAVNEALSEKVKICKQ